MFVSAATQSCCGKINTRNLHNELLLFSLRNADRWHGDGGRSSSRTPWASREQISAEVRPVSLNLPEQLYWHIRGHTKVKSEQLCKHSSPRPFPGGFVGEAAQRKATTHDWPAQAQGAGHGGGCPRDSCALAHWSAESRKRAGNAKQDFRVRRERRAATPEDDWSFPSRGGALGFWIGPI